MPSIKFKVSHGLTYYHDLPSNWIDGDIREVDEVRFDYLINTFPNNFVPVEEEKAVTDGKNKMFKGGKNK